MVQRGVFVVALALAAAAVCSGAESKTSGTARGTRMMSATSSREVAAQPTEQAESAATTANKKVVCYFANWAQLRPEDFDPGLCTHIVYAFAALDAGSLTIKPSDVSVDIQKNLYKRVVALKARGVKVSIAVGGGRESAASDKYSRMVNDAGARARFVQSAVKFIEKHGFDGLDLDWEYPVCWHADCTKGRASDKQGFAALVRELRAAFQPRHWLLSAAVPAVKIFIDRGYDVPAMSQNLDWIGVMAYDMHGPWDGKTGHHAPLYSMPGDFNALLNANFAMLYWRQLGAAPSKLVLGIPFYGVTFTLADPNKHGLHAKTTGPGEGGGALAFPDICERVDRGWMIVGDARGRIGPYAFHGNQWVGYDDVIEARRKADYVKKEGLAGVMVWALHQDDYTQRCHRGVSWPLLRAIQQGLRGAAPHTNGTNNAEKLLGY